MKHELTDSPSATCRKFRVQNCHFCEDMACGDNISPAKRRIEFLEKLVKELNEKLLKGGVA